VLMGLDVLMMTSVVAKKVCRLGSCQVEPGKKSG